MGKEGIITTKGKGIDRLGTKKDGLKFIWKWIRRCELSGVDAKDKRRLPCQVCFAEAGDFEYEVILWHTHYEARVIYKGATLIRFNKEIDDTTEWKGEVLLERLQAQLKAEQLLVEYYKMIGKHLTKHHFEE